MRVVYFGTPPEAAVALQALHGAGHEIALVVTQPDRRRGRGGETSPSPVKRTALELGLDVRTPQRAAEVVDEVAASGAQLGVVVAFGQILPVELLEAVPHGFVNVHYSLLPRWRGAAPVERAILAGDAETGVCLMALEEGLDTGAVYAQARVPIEPGDTAGSLRAELADRGARLLVDEIERVPTTDPVPQAGEATYARKLTPEEFRLDWSQPADVIARTVRAANPNPGAWTEAAGRRLKVWRAHAAPAGEVPAGEVPSGDGLAGGDAARDAEPGTLLEGHAVVTGDGVVVLDEVQVEGKRAVPGEEWRRGTRADRLQ